MTQEAFTFREGMLVRHRDGRLSGVCKERDKQALLFAKSSIRLERFDNFKFVGFDKNRPIYEDHPLDILEVYEYKHKGAVLPSMYDLLSASLTVQNSTLDNYYIQVYTEAI